MYGSGPSTSTAPSVSRPYRRLRAAPEGWSLDSIRAAALMDQQGHVYVGGQDGLLRFGQRQDFEDFMSNQQRGLTPERLAVLYQIVEKRRIPYSGPVSQAPDGTTVEALLPKNGLRTDANDMIHLGTLRVHQADYGVFRDVQLRLAERNPEAVDLLYHMQHAREAVTFRTTNEPEAFHETNGNILQWNPRVASRDAMNEARVPPSTALLHEEAHWAVGAAGDLLASIPSISFGDFEEQRVMHMDGAEVRDLRKLRDSLGDRYDPRHSRLGPRASHYGSSLPVRDIDSVDSSIEIKRGRNTYWEHAPEGWGQAGKVLDVTRTSATFATRGQGTNLDDRVSVKLDDLGFGMGGRDNAFALLGDAKANGDSASVKLTSKGIEYTNPQQKARFVRETAAGRPPQMTYPDKPMDLDRPLPSSSRAVGR